jgi:dTDP-4-amino-4,6-dideoxygalactose transaminase
MKKLLIGSTFPLTLIRQNVSIKPVELPCLLKAAEDCEIISFWGHSNTLEVAEKMLGFSVKPATERPCLLLTENMLPSIDGLEFDECWIVSPQYRPGLRPAMGAEVDLNDITGWHILHMDWDKQTDYSSHDKTGKFQWPPVIEGLDEHIAKYIRNGEPLSIAGRSGTVYEELENLFAGLHKRKYGLLTSSGTMALYSAFFGLNLQAGDEVICTVYSYHATAAPLLHLGVKIRFCDVEPDTGNLNAEKLPTLLGPKTKAVITNDQWGHPVDKEPIVKFCRENDLYYIEDCSHAHFSEYKGKFCGTFGDVACWSFQGNKLLSGGEGGIMLTDNQDIYERAVLLGHNLKRPFECVKSDKYKDYERTGFGLKLRIHPLAAAIVLYQLKYCCQNWIASRKKTLEYFQEELCTKTPFQPMVKREYVSSMGAWYGFKPRLDFTEYGFSRQELVDYMQQKGFEVDIPGSPPLTEFRLFKDEIMNITPETPPEEIFPGAYKYTSSIISLPTFTFEQDRPVINAMVNTFCDFFKKSGKI